MSTDSSMPLPGAVGQAATSTVLPHAEHQSGAQSTTQAQAQTQTQTQPCWTLPPSIKPREVLPDRYTPPSALEPGKPKGKESDPGRMGVYVCLLDDRPHLYPSLLALNRHRLAAHQIPLPSDPANDHPSTRQSPPMISNALTDGAVSTSKGNGVPSSQPIEGDQGGDVEMVGPGLQKAILRQPISVEGTKGKEWFMWKFTEEEETRRRAFLPLA